MQPFSRASEFRWLTAAVLLTAAMLLGRFGMGTYSSAPLVLVARRKPGARPPALVPKSLCRLLYRRYQPSDTAAQTACYNAAVKSSSFQVRLPFRTRVSSTEFRKLARAFVKAPRALVDPGPGGYASNFRCDLEELPRIHEERLRREGWHVTADGIATRNKPSAGKTSDGK